jgi:multidrug efflux pump subunit AcrA (membrane-fusion protein)
MPEGNTVWVIENGTAQHRTIVVGDFIRNGVVVKEGLSAGDTVITAGQQKLFTGAKVKFEN